MSTPRQTPYRWIPTVTSLRSLRGVHYYAEEICGELKPNAKASPS